ncbi:putative D-xylose utilization operon transcriptional repressor [Rubrobacter xylanophilus DSM 9941]|uniref:GntR family transcriptional regulator n=1 Tax=Rubrobacter xylanophilus TaxID=49319 RepID=UPI001C640A87|nr:GntR family transcriptional regulator [Rubrobacter xylanophilus]QYJ16604.1 putative D-xylose utilization operon transcriptional repressor [Rubrobacter xylanophilus DSM 9941]
MSLTRTVLREQIRELLLERIIKGELRPGDRIVELQIAQELGTSQAPVREALRELQYLGFVEHEPYRGTRVRRVTEEELAEIYPVRAALEELAAREAARRLGGDVEGLEEEFEAMRQAADRESLHDLAVHDTAFHRRIVEAAGNRVLLDTWKTLRVEARVVVTALKTDVDLHELAELHRPLLEAIREGSPEKAGAALRRHFETLRTMMKRGERA